MHISAIQEGVAFVWNRKELLGAMTLDMFAVLFGGARALLPVYAIDILHANVYYGILLGVLEAGTLLMAVILIVIRPPTNAGRILLVSVAAFGLATVLFGVSTLTLPSVAPTHWWDGG